MDMGTHYTWKLTRDEIETIQDALENRATLLEQKASETSNANVKECRERLANRCYELIRQIRQLKRGHSWY